MPNRLVLRTAIALAAVVGAVTSAAAQVKYPTRFVKVITTAGTGTGTDVVLRILADRLSREWGQQLVIENMPAAGGLVAAQQAMAAEHDGYTLLQASSSSFTVLPIRHERAPTRVGIDLKPIAYMGDQPLVIAVAPTLGVGSIKELLALAKSQPNKLLYAANANGSLPHTAGELLKLRSGAPLQYVPYRGGAEGLKDMLAGQINMIIDGYAALDGTIRSGHIKMIAVTSAKRLPNFADMPTVAETLPGYEAIGWAALSAPIGVPDNIVQKINADVVALMRDPALVKRMEDVGAYMVPMSTTELAAFIKRQQDVLWPVVREILSKSADAAPKK